MSCCSIEGCERPQIARTWCPTHYKRWHVHGSPLVVRAKREDGAGNLRPDGYVQLQIAGVRHMEHILLVEHALGHALPVGAKVHHINGNRADNRHCNLVICQDDAYHKLLHNRANAIKAGHPAHYRKCPYCKQYDAPSRMAKAGLSYRHKQCLKVYDRKRNERRKRDDS